MRLNPRLKTIGSLGLFITALLMLTFLEACNRFDKDDANRQAQTKKGPDPISVENGQTVLTLDTSTQNHLGVEVATLTATATHAQFTVPAVVLSVLDLTTFRNGYIATQAQLQKSRVEADVARKEYTRLKTLFQQNQNISEKALQSADGTLQTNEADIRAGEQQLSLEESVARQQWGNIATKWAVDASPEFQRLLDQREVLVQITMPSGETFAPAQSISLEIPGGIRTTASFVSTFPRVDPRIQGRSFLYKALAQPNLMPGENLLAHFSVGNQMQGVIVPTSAIVWSEGKAWVYQLTAPERFTRRSVPSAIPVEKGFFVAQGFSPGDRVVTQGAQSLLSEELLLHGQAGGVSDED
jgi:hypothetical protein